jgi:hypothetical protein
MKLNRIVAIIYDKMIRRFVKKLSEAVHMLCSRIWNKLAAWATRFTENQE